MISSTVITRPTDIDVDIARVVRAADYRIKQVFVYRIDRLIPQYTTDSLLQHEASCRTKGELKCHNYRTLWVMTSLWRKYQPLPANINTCAQHTILGLLAVHTCPPFMKSTITYVFSLFVGSCVLFFHNMLKLKNCCV